MIVLSDGQVHGSGWFQGAFRTTGRCFPSHRARRGWRRAGSRDLNQFQQIVPAQTCLVKNINKCSFCEFLMQGNDGSIGCLLVFLFKRYMAALLPDYNESCLFKRSDEFIPGNNWQFRHRLLQLWSRTAWISHEGDLLRSFRYKAQ